MAVIGSKYTCSSEQDESYIAFYKQVLEVIHHFCSTLIVEVATSPA